MESSQEEEDDSQESSPHGRVRPFHQKSTCITQLTLGPIEVQIWSRNTLELRGNGTRVPGVARPGVVGPGGGWQCRHRDRTATVRGEPVRIRDVPVC